MNLDEAISRCHVRSAIYMESIPKARFWKNHTIPLKEQIPEEFHSATDWKEYDPREDEDCSLFMYND